jgi:hypothetical protein
VQDGSGLWIHTAAQIQRQGRRGESKTPVMTKGMAGYAQLTLRNTFLFTKTGEQDHSLRFTAVKVDHCSCHHV